MQFAQLPRANVTGFAIDLLRDLSPRCDLSIIDLNPEETLEIPYHEVAIVVRPLIGDALVENPMGDKNVLRGQLGFFPSGSTYITATKNNGCRFLMTTVPMANEEVIVCPFDFFEHISTRRSYSLVQPWQIDPRQSYFVQYRRVAIEPRVQVKPKPVPRGLLSVYILTDGNGFLDGSNGRIPCDSGDIVYLEPGDIGHIAAGINGAEIDWFIVRP